MLENFFATNYTILELKICEEKVFFVFLASTNNIDNLEDHLQDIRTIQS